AAGEAGVTTINAFFTAELAREFQKAGMEADLFLANNVLAHVPDLNGFVEGIGLLLKEDGTAVIEAPYLLDLIRNCEFDTIYHQHLCYFSVTALDRLFRRHGLFLNEVKRTPLHGGSLRLFLGKKEAIGDSTRALLEDEAGKGAGEAPFYRSFAGRVEALRDALMDRLHALKEEGRRIAAYGAAAKACTLLNFCGIDGRLVDYVADLNAFKQGRFMGGNHLPIEPPEKILQDPPDVLLILAWNFADEIMEQLADFRSKGGRFLLPVPEVRIV
ncbi:MAG: class I SAM-dependent methyltransferase, partial [Planctomycetota bacterium]